MRISVIGLGSMGAPIARRLLAAGHTVTGYNRTRARAEALTGEGLIVAESPAAAAMASELLITMVSDDSALRELILPGDRLACGSNPGLVHVCMSTISDALAERLEAAHADAQQHYVSAPVFGPPDAAQNGKLFIAAAGADAALATARPALAVLGRIEVIATKPAAANVVKMAGNFLMADAVEGLRESIGVVTAAGADPTQFIALITQALFPTPVYQFIGGSIASRARDGGLRIANPFVRGAELTAQAAERLGVAAPIAREISKPGQGKPST